MPAKPIPDFSAKHFADMSARTRLHLIRTFVLDHAGPIAKDDVRRLLAQTLKISIEMIAETRTTSRWSKDQIEATRLLHEQIAFYDRR